MHASTHAELLLHCGTLTSKVAVTREEVVNVESASGRLWLFLSEEYPRLGASPDGFVPCDCCGQGCMEIKCPYCMKDENIREGKNSCLKKVNGVLKLKTNHPYFYQVQTQMLVSSMDYCEFIVWTDQDLFGQRIM
ncbi:hypothetical protein LSH36_2687g00008, partial [Paralvinella palmiformis]